ncbi:MAG: PLP-dependent aminotransferase family protein [bacterium]|nr:PLP-dependent aminotransferase family protein [bacterium]
MNPRILYDFKTGYPNLELVPRQRLHDLAALILERGHSLQYAGDLAGTMRAREQIAALIAHLYDRPVNALEVMVTTGALHSIDVTCRALTMPGDVVLVESPTFYFGVNILQMSRVEVVGVPMRETGIDLDALEAACQTYAGRVKVVYTIPSFHNPTGITATVENRQGLVQLAQRYGFTILEDATYQPLSFGAPPPPIVRAFDDGDCTVTVASVSKLLMPALRVGWIYASPAKVKVLTGFKGDGGTSMFNTEIAASFIEAGDFPAQIAAARAFYARRHHLMIAALDRHAPEWLEWSAPDGGYFIWARLPDGKSAAALHRAAVEQGIDFFRGSASYADGQDDAHVRLCFAYEQEALIEPGIAALCALMRNLP